MKPERETMDDEVITLHGGYRHLKSFRHAELVYDATVKFCERLIDRRTYSTYFLFNPRSGSLNLQ